MIYISEIAMFLQTGVYIYIYQQRVYIYIYQHCTDEAQKAETVLSAVIYIYIYIYIIWSKTFIATQSFMLLPEQSSGNCQN